MSGPVISSDEEGYQAAREVWNAAVLHEPAIIACCVSAADVQAAVSVAVHDGLPLSVKAGGHDWAGRSLRHGGIVIDLSRMRSVAVDPLTRAATVEGGATIGDLVRACRPHALAPVTGTVRTVGMAGLTLAGGYGPLAGRCGLVLDNLLAAEVVLADGRRVIADALTSPELFWALRGGGGNFGVVTRLRYRLHPFEQVVGGLAVFPMRDARAVMRGYRELLASAPDELTIQMGFMATPEGPGIFLFPTWCGERAGGEKLLGSLARLGSPLSFHIGPTAYEDLLATFDVFGGRGRHWALQSRSLYGLSDDTEVVLLDAGKGLTSPISAIGVHHFHGVAARVPEEATAFGLREDHLMVKLIAGWEPSADDDGSRHRSWVNRAAEALESQALPGGYPNLLGPKEQARALQSYGPNVTRLLALKRRFDPDNVFGSATPALGEGGLARVA